MIVALFSSTSQIGQLITVLLVFALVLFVTFFTTKWIAGFQQDKQKGSNISIIETTRISTNKYAQIIKVAGKYYSIIVCKDTVTYLGELNEEEITFPKTAESFSFKDFLNKAKENGNENK